MINKTNTYIVKTFDDIATINRDDMLMHTNVLYGNHITQTVTNDNSINNEVSEVCQEIVELFMKLDVLLDEAKSSLT